MAGIAPSYDGDETLRSAWSRAGAAGTSESTASAGTSLRASMTLQRSLSAKVTHPREVLGAHGEGLAQLGARRLSPRLAAARPSARGRAARRGARRSGST